MKSHMDNLTHERYRLSPWTTVPAYKSKQPNRTNQTSRPKPVRIEHDRADRIDRFRPDRLVQSTQASRVSENMNKDIQLKLKSVLICLTNTEQDYSSEVSLSGMSQMENILRLKSLILQKRFQKKTFQRERESARYIFVDGRSVDDEM